MSSATHKRRNKMLCPLPRRVALGFSRCSGHRVCSTAPADLSLVLQRIRVHCCLHVSFLSAVFKLERLPPCDVQRTDSNVALLDDRLTLENRRNNY